MDGHPEKGGDRAPDACDGVSPLPDSEARLPIWEALEFCS